MADRVAASVVHRCLTKTTRLTNKGSIFRAELYARTVTLQCLVPVDLWLHDAVQFRCAAKWGEKCC